MGAQARRAVDRGGRWKRRPSDEHGDPAHPRRRGGGSGGEARPQPRRDRSQGRLPNHAHAGCPGRRGTHREPRRAARRRARPQDPIRLFSVAVPGRGSGAVSRRRDDRRVNPPPFEYHAPATVEEACSLLGSLEDAKVLAGGQSLIPLLNFRLARPRHLVDINRVSGLDRIYERDGGVAVQAMVRQAAVEDSDLVARICPLLGVAVRLVAHRVIRNRGTVCGSLAHADPASELPAVLLALGGHAVARSTRGERTIPADQLFSGLFETTLAPDEMVVEAWFPASGRPFAILEESRRHGDFALAGVVRADARLALFGVASTPVMADPRDPTLGLQPGGDLEASADFRLHLVRVLTEKAFAASGSTASTDPPRPMQGGCSPTTCVTSSA